MAKVRITIDITLEHQQWITQTTKEQKISRNKLIERAIENYKKTLELEREVKNG